jgi:hypothetical protein
MSESQNAALKRCATGHSNCETAFRQMHEMMKQLSLTAESKEGQRGQDSVEEFCCQW